MSNRDSTLHRRGARLKRATTIALEWSIAAARSSVTCGLAAARLLPRATMELVFPAACLSCRTELNGDNGGLRGLPICDDCYESLDLLHEPMCRRCGGPLPLLSDGAGDGDGHGIAAQKHDGCYRCRGRHKLWFDETIAAGLYEGRLRELLLTMKTDKGDALSLALGQLVWQLRRERLKSLNVDVVAPIPLHWRRRLAHRTNSAAILAEVLAGRLGVPLADGLLRRRRATRPQSELTPPKRWENVRQAFTVGGAYHLKQAHVLVVDDILTTGATCSEAARALRKAGAASVSIAVVARAIG